MKKFTSVFLTLLFVVVTQATFAQQAALAPMAVAAQGQTVSSHMGDVDPVIQASVKSTLRATTNMIWFEKNAGQFNNPEVLYGFRTAFGSMGVYNNKIRIVTNQKEWDEEENEANESKEGMPLQIVDLTFPGANGKWTVEPGTVSSVTGTYYTTTDKNEKGIRPLIYNEITLKNVYPGIDLRLYSGQSGAMEFDWIVSKAADYSKIKMQMTGQDALVAEKEGNITIKMHENNMTLMIPETFQTIGGSKKPYKASMVKVSDNILAYQVETGFDPAQPLVIDPVMMWSTYMHNGSSSFDEYLYSIASNSAGEVYCAGFTNEAMSVSYLNNVAAGYSNAYSTNPSTVLYKLNATGTNILAWTMTGVTGAANFPSDLDIFPDGRILLSYTEDVVQIFSATLAARSYSGSINTAAPANANHGVYQSVVAIDNATFYVSGSCTSAFPTSIVPANAPDPTFAGSSEGFIIRVTGANTTSLTAAWGTYVGGNNNETFASIASSTDKTKLAFAVHTVVGSGYPGTVNPVDNTIAGSTEILVGSFPISATPQTAFTAFSYLGGSSSEGLSTYSAIAGGPQGADKAVVCADNNYFYVGYNSSSTDIPGTTGVVQTSNRGGMDQVLARIPWNGSAGSGFVETYNGGSSDDLVGGIAVDFRSSNVLLFGTTTSSDYPANNTTPASPYYQNSFGGIIDISYASFSNNLATRTYGTYLGGSEKDYMGSTGILRGSGHLYYNNTNGLTYIGTTIHSDQSTVPAQWITNVPGFDKSIPAQTAGKDNHFIFEWNSNTFDYGDAPTAYDGSNAARSALTDKLRLGLTIDAETAALSSSQANGDDLSNTGSADDEDGVATIPTAFTGATTYSVSVSVYNNTGTTVNLRGWIDANGNGSFDAAESALVSVPTSTSQQTVTLSFTGLPAFVYGSGNTFLRIRVADATLSATAAQGEVGAGEVEDYQVCIKPNAGSDQSVCLVGTATMAASGTGTWSARAGNPGTATIASITNPSTTISNFSTTGTYGFVWTNATGCTDTVLVTVTTQPGAVTITPAAANICVGNSINLTASVSPSGGTFQWSPLSNITPVAGNTATVTVSPTSTQTYSVVYTLGGCTSSASRLVTVYPVVAADAGPNQTYCSNVSTTITLGGAPTASGGSNSYSYAWSPPTNLSSISIANPFITSVVSGTTTYYVTVTDNVTGCTSRDSMTLVINPAVTVSIALSDTDLCLGQVTTLAATGTPAGGTYSWSPTIGMTPAAGNTASVSVGPSANQTYTVLYSLAGCTNSASRKVNVYPTVGAEAGADQTYCLPVGTLPSIGGSPTATSGSGSYTYSWSPTTRLNNPNAANPTLTSAVASSIVYYVTVTDTKSGCTAVDSMRMTINSQATVTISSPDTSLCAGQSTTLSASGLPAGGTYSWSPTNYMTPVAGNTATVTVAPPANQTYQVTYTASGCSGTATKTVNVVPAVAAHAGGNQTYCMPYATTITLGVPGGTATGGSGNFSYNWSPTTRLSNASVANPTLTSNVASTITYYVTVTDNVSGCTSVDSAVITLNPAVVASAGPATSVCNGLGVTIGGSPTGSGGTGTLTYSWSPTTGLSSSTAANPVASPTVLTTYTVTVTDSKGCSATSAVTVTVNPKPTADAGPGQNLTACSAASVVIGGSPTASGGTPGYTYLWSPAGGLSSSTIANPSVSQIGSTTLYTVTVTDAKGCTSAASVNVTVVGSTLQVDAGVNASYCANSGSSTVLTGTVTGGTAPYTYQWSPATGLSSTSSISTTANPSAAGSYLYTLNVTDNNGCNASDTVRLTVWPSVVASAGSAVSICNGSSTTIGGVPTASGGTSPFVYAWAPGTGLSSTSIANPVASPLLNTTYNVTVTDAHSCSATSSVAVTVNTNPLAHAGSNQTYCLPVTSIITLGAVPAATGGSGTYSYTWSPSTGLNNAGVANPTVTVSGAGSTKYYLTVTDGNGCYGVDSTNLTILPQPSVSVAAADTDICTGQTTTLTASGSPAGGTYQWYPQVSMTPSSGAAASVDVAPTTNQTYFVIYTQGSCSDTASKTVRVFSNVVASAGPNQTYCLPVTSTITLGGVPSASGGSGSYTYAWSPSGNLSSASVANPTVTSVAAGTTIYSLTVTDKVSGCQATSTMTLVINPTATVTISPTDTDLCTGQSTTLTAVGSPGGGTYQWSPTFNMSPGAGNSASVTVAPSGTQRYQVTYTANGCAGSTAITVNVYPNVVAHAGINQAFCLPYSGTIFLGSSSAATGGSGSYSYHWSPTANLSDSAAPNPIVAKVNTNTEYYLTVTDNVTGCSSVDSTHITIDTHATLTINSSDTDLCFGQTTVLNGVASPAGGTYQWIPIVYLYPGTGNTPSVTVGPVTTQLYELIYSRNGCQDTAYKQVNVYPTVVADAGPDQTFCLPQSGTVTLGGSPTAAGGSGAFSYTWAPSTNLNDTSASNPVLTALVPGTYKYFVTVTDNKSGCTSVDSTVLTISPSVSVSATASQTNICGGGSAVLTATGTPAGGNYQWNPIIAMSPANGNAAVVTVTPNPGTQAYFVYYDLNGCRDTDMVTITTYPQPLVDAGPDQSYCLPVTSIVRVGNTATGGSGNFSYHWSPAGNVSDSAAARPRVTQLTTSGTTDYVVAVTDLTTGCIAMDSAKVTINVKPSIVITSPDTDLCSGQCATLTAAGSPAGGNYQWTPTGNLTPFAGNTAAVTFCPTGVGSFHLQVIYGDLTSFVTNDGDTIVTPTGCYDTAYKTINVFSTPVAHAGGNKAYCLPVSGTIALGDTPTATGGSGRYIYTWSPSFGLSDSTAAHPLVADTAVLNVMYHLTVTDSISGCTAFDSARIIINPQSTVSISSADTDLCVGQNTTLTAVGAPPGGTYMWSGPFITPAAANTASVSVAPTGTQTYTVVYTLSNCSATAYKTVRVFSGPVAHAGPNKSFCPPTTSVQIGQNATGGSGSYTYLWASSPAGFTSTSVSPTVTPTAGTTIYYVTVTDAISGCTGTDSVIVTKHSAPPVDASDDKGICAGGSTQLIATGALSYQWSPTGGSMVPSNGASQTVTVAPTATTSYTVVGTDIFGCTASDTVQVRISPSLVVFVPSIMMCQGDTAGLRVNLTGPNYRYQWSPSIGITCLTCAYPLVSPSTINNFYTVTVTDTITGCTGTYTDTVTAHERPQSHFAADIVCAGTPVGFHDQSASSDGAITSWFYNFGDTTTLADTSHLQNPSYTYTSYASSYDAYQMVTTIYGCSDTSHSQITAHPPVIPTAGPDTVIGQGSSVVLSATGGTSYVWSPTTGLSSPNSSNPVATPLATTTYYVTVTNSFGCIGTDSVHVVVVLAPDVTAGPDTFVCVGSPMTLQGFSKVSGATYQWFSSPPLYIDTPTHARPTVVPSFPGVYTMILKVTYFRNGIYVSAYDTMYLTANPVPVITATPDSATICSGSAYHIALSSSLPGTTITWTGSDGSSGSGNAINATVINNGTTDSLITYMVIGTQPGGCADTIRVPVVIRPIPTVSKSGFPTEICSGTTFAGTVTSNIPGATINWSSNTGLNGTGGNISVILNNPNPTAQLVIFSFTASYGSCTSTVLYDTVRVNPLPSADAGPDQTIAACSTDSVQIGGAPTASGGTPIYTYLWSPPIGITGYTTASNPYVRHLGANTTYTVTVTDKKGCTATDQVVVRVTPATLAISITPPANSSSLTWCENSGQSVDLTVNVTGGTAGYTYLWTPTTNLSDTDQQVTTANPQMAGSYPYTILVTDASGCQASLSRTITVKPLPHPVIIGLDSHYCASSPQVALTASISGGTWSGAGVVNTGSGFVFRPASVGAGSYLITYTVTQNGCTHDTSQVVVVDPLPTVSITGNNPSYCTFDALDTFTGTPAGGTWSGPGINASTGVFNPALVSVPNNISTTVTIRYRLAGGSTTCTDSTSVNITIYKSLPVTVTASADTTCQGGAIVLTPSYPSQPIANNIQWYDVNGTFITNSLNSITVHPTRPNHGYVAVISSLQGCSARDTITLHVNQPPVAVDDYDSTCLNTPFTFDVTINDTDPERNGSTVRVLSVKYGTASVVSNNVMYTPVYGYHGLDTVTYQICNVNCTADCDTGKAYIYVCPQNLPPTADTIRYTAYQNTPHDVNVELATSDPNGDPLNISIVGTYDTTLTVIQTSNGAYTVTGTTVGTYPIVYQVCDTDQYPIHVLCDTAVIFANIIPNNPLVNHPPVANNDFATTTGIQPAIVNVRGNDTDPDGNPLTIPALGGSGVTTHGHFTVNAVDGSIIFQPNTGLAQGIYYDTVNYCISDITTIAPQPLTSCAILVITINEIDVPGNRPPVAVDDHVSVAQGTPVNVNVKGNDSDPDGDPLGTPTVLTATTAGTIISVSSNGTVVYVPNPGIHSINGQPIDSFTYRVCDTLSINPPVGLCDTANVYVFVNPANLPPTADTVRYTQLVGTPHDVNILLAVSDPNADPLTITVIGTPDPSLNIVRTGNGGYTITGTTPGTYTIQYQVCDTDQYPVHVLCATSVIVATIVPDTSSPLPPVANNDYATTTGTPAVVNVRGNDSDPQGNPLTTPTIVGVINIIPHGTWSVDGSGNVVFTPTPGLPAAIYYDTVRYQVCDAVYPGLCATALVIVTTNLVDTPIANRPPLAVDDHLTVPQNSVNAVVNVKGNDSDPDGDPLGTPTIIAGVHNGTIGSVSTNGDVTYTPVPYLHSINGQPVDSFVYVICDTLSAHAPAPKCDTATAYINVAGQNLPPVANNIYVSTPENTPLGVNVASGAYDPNGDPLHYTYPAGGSSTQGGAVVTTGNGSVNYFPPTGFTGVDSFQYSVCDTSPYVVHVLCDSAWVVVNVTNPGDTFANHPPVASNDYGVTVPGATTNVNVIANDSDPDGNPIRVTTVTATTSLGGTATIGFNNTVNYTAPATVADSIVVDTFSYVICDSSSRPVYSLCDTALVFITINKYDTPTIHHNLPPVAVDDFSHICQDEYSFVNVLNNDIDPNGDVLTVTSIVTAPTHGIAAVSSPSIAYIPAQYFFGQDSLQYRVCDTRTPAQCDTAWVHYTVNLINHRPLAAQDTISTNMNTAVNVAVTLNDEEPDHDSTTLAIVTPPVHGTAVQVGNTYTYTPTPGYAGDDTFYYRVCDVMNPAATYCSPYTPLCDVGMVSIHVLHHPPHIPPTFDTIPQDTTTVTICLMLSDTDGNSVKVTSFPCGAYHGTAGFASGDSCVTYLPNPGFVGNDSFCVVVCDNVIPALCDTDYVHITVTPKCIPPVAVADTFTVFHLVSGAVLNVTANDTNHTASALSVSIITAPATGIAFVSGNTIRYTPTVTSGTDQFTYAICSVNPVCTSCDTGTVFVNITGTATTPPVAVNDTVRIPQDSSVCVAVMANDRPGSNPIHVTGATTPSHGTNTVSAGGVICYVPTHGFFGTDSFHYTICDNGAPQLCSTATVIVTVTPNPHPPVAVNDYATSTQGTLVVVNVTGNDSDPDGNLNTGSVTLVTLPAHGAVTNIDAVTGAVTYLPTAGPYVGIDSFKYSVCDSTPVSLGGPLCATATVYINITPANHPPHAPDTTVTIPQDSFILVCPVVTDMDPGQIITTASVCPPSHGSAVIIAGSTCVTYTPAPGFVGIDSFCYVACDNGTPGLCDTGIITIVVTPVPHCPVAVKDFVNAADTIAVVINELNNDRNVGTVGAGYSVTILNGPDAGNTAVLNANGTITYTAAAGYVGIDHINYFVYDSVDHCGDSAQILIYVVDTACIGPVAYDDAATVCEGSIVSLNVLANDYLGNNTSVPVVSVIGTGSHGLGYVNTTTGLVEYAAPNLYHGTDIVTYQVCTSCPSGPRCDTGTIAINILITNHAPVAVDDTATMIEDHIDTIDVVSNDYDVDGDPLTVSISAQPANGTLRVAGNKLIYTPYPNYCGTDTFGYQVTGLTGSPACPGQRAWDLGLVFVNITCVPDTPVIPDTLVHVPEDSIITVCIPYTDPDLGDHHTATVLCAPSHGTWVSIPTASDTPQTVCMTYKPDSNYHGIDSACIVICDNTTPTPLCDTSHVTIIVDPRNEPPVVQDQYVSTPENTPVGVNISTGASDPNGDPLTYGYPGPGPGHGTWTPDAHNNGTGIYTPAAGYLGADSFTVVVCDNSPYFVNVLCDTATVYVNVYDTSSVPNHAPVANTDYAVTDTAQAIIVYVAANDLDPDGDQLTIPHIVPGPTAGGHGDIGYNAANQVVFTPVGPFSSPITVDSFQYSICDTLSAHTPAPLCDTAWAYITINAVDTSVHQNLPPVAVDDYASTQYGHDVIIPVLHNDSDPNGDPIHVTTTVLPGDSVAQDGTVTVNANGTITYAPFTGPGRGPNANNPDTFYYVICDTSAYLPHSLCDTARVVVTVPNSVQGVNDNTLTGSTVAVTVHVKANDYDPELDSFYVVGTMVQPHNGTAVLTDSVNGIYTYTPNGTICSPTGGVTDSFAYEVMDVYGAIDTAWVYVHVKCCEVVANDDTFSIYQGDSLIAGILVNDNLDPTIPHHITFGNTTNLHGTLAVVGDSVIFRPDSGYCGTSFFTYVVSDTCGRDTANVSIHITCANIHPPTLVNDTIGLCYGTDSIINVLANDYDIDSNAIAIDTFTQGSHGAVVRSGTSLLYTPVAGYMGRDTFTYRACDNGVPVLCSTATVFIDIHKCSPPIIVDTTVHDTVLACSQNNTICIDSIYMGPGYSVHFTGFCDSSDHGLTVISTVDSTTGLYGTLCITYTPDCDTIAGGTGYVGNDTICLVICSNGVDTSCTNVHVIVTVVPKPPVDSIWANDDVVYTCDAIDTIHVMANDGFEPDPGNPLTGTAIHVVVAGNSAGKAPALGTITIVGNDIIYTPNPSEDGTDTFRYVIADNGNPQQFDTATVYVYVCKLPPIHTVDDNGSCMDTTALVNTPGTIHVIDNDTLIPATDTVMAIVTKPQHGQATVNPDFTITFTPDSGFFGSDNLEYSVCESVTGSTLVTCDTASVCINVVDTVTPCFFPTGFSPNDDTYNDVFTFPCAEKFPNATIKIFNRWGDEVYESVGPYRNDWSGTNMQGNKLPDGTYYFIYQYNDGSGKSEARFVVLHR
ncbi:MAG: tandem-95 repeat protein [Bacteroidetes bacterium]|nr:tandem-95 repeat protein [Bacteroidota bacterium]